MEKGFSIIQVLVLIGALAGGSAIFMNQMQERGKISKTSDVKMTQNLLRKELAEAFADAALCLKTFEIGATQDLTGDLSVSTLKTDSGENIYPVGSSHEKLLIKSLLLDLPEDYPAAYSTAGTLRIVPATFRTKVEWVAPNQKNTPYGGKDAFLNIPIRLLVLNQRIQSCISADSGSVLDALITACTNLKGTYNHATGTCENLQGPSSHVAIYLRDYFCSESPATCSSHPYAGQSCSRSGLTPSPTKVLPVDMEDNAVFNGFNPDGSVRCSCAVRICPDPALYCLGTDLGDDWCYNDCPDGTRVCT